jgi:hypothetical protein
MAIAIESSGLHEKIALKIMMLFGSDPKWFILLPQKVQNNNM